MPLIVGTSGSAWTYGAAILSFVFPMILFLAVITWLYVTYTKPSVVPGHREQAVARPIGFTPVVRMPARDEASPGGPAGPRDAASRPGNPEAAE